jgi:hypothetical protein
MIRVTASGGRRHSIRPDDGARELHANGPCNLLYSDELSSTLPRRETSLYESFYGLAQSPFALAPAAWLLRPARFIPLVVAYALSAAISGWVSYGTFVDGPLPRLHPRGAATDEAALGAFLKERGVSVAMAQYWLAYRLTFLFEERLLVVPLNPGEDRYPPYREKLSRAARLAYVFHPSEPRALPGPHEQALLAIESIYALEIHGDPFTTQQHVQAFVAEARALCREFAQSRTDRRVP